MTCEENYPPSALITREKRAFFNLNSTGEITSSRRRQLARPLVLFYVSAAALIILSYFFDEHIIAELAIIQGLEADLARQEFLKHILSSAAFVVAIMVAVYGGGDSESLFHADIPGQLHHRRFRAGRRLCHPPKCKPEYFRPH